MKQDEERMPVYYLNLSQSLKYQEHIYLRILMEWRKHVEHYSRPSFLGKGLIVPGDLLHASFGCIIGSQIDYQEWSVVPGADEP